MDSILRRLATFNVVIIEYPHNQTRVECLRAHFLDEVVNLPIQIPRPDIRELRVPAIPEDIVIGESDGIPYWLNHRHAIGDRLPIEARIEPVALEPVPRPGLAAYEVRSLEQQERRATLQGQVVYPLEPRLSVIQPP